MCKKVVLIIAIVVVAFAVVLTAFSYSAKPYADAPYACASDSDCVPSADYYKYGIAQHASPGCLNKQFVSLHAPIPSSKLVARSADWNCTCVSDKCARK